MTLRIGVSRLFPLLLFSIASANQFCKGWDDGFKAGYCYQKYSCLDPLVPLCPLQTLRDEEGYQGGYNRGFVAGQARETARAQPYAPSTTRPIIRSTDRQQKLYDAASDFGNTWAQIAESNRQKKEAEERAEYQKAEYLANMKRRAVEFSAEFPDQPNPYAEQLAAIAMKEKRDKEMSAIRAERAKKAFFIIGAATLVAVSIVVVSTQ